MQHEAEDDGQALRPVDPGVAIENPAPFPQASDLGVPPLVRRERRIPEGRPYRERERDRRAAEQRWGPPRADLDARMALRAAIAFALALAVAIFIFGLSLTPDRFLVVLLVPALVIRRPGRYLLDFLPFAALINLYAECRGLPHMVHPVPHYLPQLRAERFLFAGHLPTVDLQDWLWSGDPRLFDRAVLYVTRIHSIVPMSIAFALWLKRRALFYRFAVTFLTLSFAAALTFWLFPSAPPWAAAEKGLVNVTKIGGTHVATSSVQTGGGTIYRLIHGNPYAAIPSLHGGYAFLIFLFVATLAWRAGRRRLTIGLAALYPALQSFAVLYTGNHYVVDLLIGFAYATAAFLGVQWCWRRLGLPE